MSLIIGIRFLTGYCVASRSKTDGVPEWPPHPARIYMALAAAHFECAPDEAARDALAWLETLDPPVIHLGAQAMPTEAIPTFVPMNDSRAVGRGGSIQSLPSLKRHRAERLFPRTHLPENQDCVYLCWPQATQAEVDRHRDALTRLCGLVARVGHSSSLVQLWLEEQPPSGLMTLVPDVQSQEKLRVVARTSGTLERLTLAFQTPPYRPSLKSSHGYAQLQPASLAVASTPFDDQLELFRLESAGSPFRSLQLESTLALCFTLRQAIMERCPTQPPPQSISGHAADGSPATSPHMAIFPLPFVSGDHGDGHLLGVGVALPRQMEQAEQRALLEALEAIADEGGGLGFDQKRFPGLGQWKLIRQGLFDDYRVNLQGTTWTAFPRGCRSWASVTPVAFDCHGKSRSKAAYLKECAELIAESVRRMATGACIEQLRLTPLSPIRGVPPAHDFPRIQRKDGSQRRHTHVQILFDRPVTGPLLIGAGRYRGYGLCRPMPEEKMG